MTQSTSSLSRRNFITLAGGAALALPFYAPRAWGANNRVRVAMISCGGRAGSLRNAFQRIPDVDIAAVCDPDTARMDAMVAKMLEGENPPPAPDKVRDYRRVLERKDIDAVVLATPNHWHALQSIQAMQAGKAVYVEKPVTHNLWEGRQLVAAAEKHNGIIQAGYQNRSDPACIEGIKFVREGNLGKVHSVHVCCFRNRNSIGKRETALVPPATVDYDLWLGPAQDLPIYRPKLHYDWHWDFNTGNGDIGNQCPHEIDLACWATGDGPLPTSIRSFGGRLGWNDAGNTPNMISAWYEQGGTPVLIEVNDLKLAPDRNVPSIRNGIRVGIVVRCEGGELRGGRGGMYVVGDDGKTRIHNFPGDGGKGHQKNFIDAIRAGNGDNLHGVIKVAERSAAIAHLANISYRIGEQAKTEKVRDTVAGNPYLETILDEQAAQLTAWGIDAPSYSLGKQLDVNPEKASVETEGVDPLLSRSPGRGEFVVPELV